jgi:P27 family predicted phage terminase small subunit
VAAGVLTEADRAVLVLYCEAWSEYLTTKEFCLKEGKYLPVVLTAAGNPIQNPAIGLRNTLRLQVKQFSACLGITPADRSSVKAAPKAEPEDAKKRFFKGA